MKKILIISEQDVAILRLMEVYNSLFINEEKELIHCKIDIIDCNQTTNLFAGKSTKPSKLPKNPGEMPKLLRHLHSYKTILAQNCKDITQIILKHKINVVLIPNFIYDEGRKLQYDIIAKEIKKVSRVDILGLYI